MIVLACTLCTLQILVSGQILVILVKKEVGNIRVHDILHHCKRVQHMILGGQGDGEGGYDRDFEADVVKKVLPT